MNSYSSQTQDLTSFQDLLEKAAKRQFGHNIRVVNTLWNTEQLHKLTFEISVVSKDPEPKEARRAIIDINMKEYTNFSDKVQDETVVKVEKKTQQSSGSHYNFSTTKGKNWGFGGNIGAQVMGLSVVGGSASISGNYGRSTSKTTENGTTEGSAFEVSYVQEEKMLVPPMSKIIAKITTFSMKYEQGFVIKFSIPASVRVPVLYKTRCQQNFFGSTSRMITAAQLCSTLPDFLEADGQVSFTQQGTLSWVGQGSTIEKQVQEPYFK